MQEYVWIIRNRGNLQCTYAAAKTEDRAMALLQQVKARYNVEYAAFFYLEVVEIQ
jgi:hypothetical protein